VNEEFEDIIRRYISEANATHKIEVIIGNALDIIPTMDETFDLVFIDADKESYSHYYDLVFNKVRKGGFIIADNVLWSGKVVEEKPDSETQALKDYNDKVKADNRVEPVLFPIRDGLMICRKR
jgi:predicted O-methyltransferase YrrM